VSRRSLGRAALYRSQGVGSDGSTVLIPDWALEGRVLEGDEFVRRRPASPVVGSIAGSTAPVGPPPTAAAR